MSFKSSAVLSSLLVLLSACASAPQTADSSGINPYDYYAFDRLSRVEIAEILNIKTASLGDTAALVNASENEQMLAHENAMVRESNNSSDRLNNKSLSGGGRSYYIPAQNSFEKDGWTLDDNRLRHIESGLLCPASISLGEEGRPFTLERVIEFDDKGRDLACHYQAQDNGDAITAYASYWPDVTLEEHAAAAAQSILQNHAVTGQVTLPVVELKAEDGDAGELGELINGMEEPLAGGFEIAEVNGVPYRTSLWLVKTHGWHVKLRATYASEDQSSELLSAIHFMASHLAVRAKNMAEPIAPGVDV